jgi:hypothetical protein
MTCSAIRSPSHRSRNQPLNCGSKAQLETYMAGRPRSEIAPEAASYPFIYSADDRIDLGRILERHHTDPASLD